MNSSSSFELVFDSNYIHTLYVALKIINLSRLLNNLTLSRSWGGYTMDKGRVDPWVSHQFMGPQGPI